MQAELAEANTVIDHLKREVHFALLQLRLNLRLVLLTAVRLCSARMCASLIMAVAAALHCWHGFCYNHQGAVHTCLPVALGQKPVAIAYELGQKVLYMKN